MGDEEQECEDFVEILTAEPPPRSSMPYED